MRHLLLALATVAACTGSGTPAPAPAAGGSGPAAPREGRQSPAAQRSGYDLETDEALGGHTIGRHVGKTDDELRERLRREPEITTASTYTDLATAERVVASAVASNRGRLKEWVSRNGPRPNLVLRYGAGKGVDIGRSLARGARQARRCSAARVVIRWHDRSQRWIVLTSYPEPS